MFGIGLTELLVILLICLLLFGANRLPEIGKSLGEGIREFKRAMKESGEDNSRSKEDRK
ncbi:MAG: Sec-independent protein translocase protein TatAy [Candidatus Omnitrophica bacterium]|nr:Sec-independent protein translocase protein TatAy [Candidatus Omnitrophota bacterium]